MRVRASVKALCRNCKAVSYTHLDVYKRQEMDGVSEELAREAFRLAAAKLPIETTFMTRQIGS